MVAVLPLVVAGGLAILLGGVAGAGLLVLVLVGWVVFVFFVLIKMCLGIQTVILERLSPIAAFRRSWRLTSGSFWRIFLFYLVMAWSAAS